MSFQRYFSKGHIYKERSDANNIAVKKTRYQKTPKEQEQEYPWLNLKGKGIMYKLNIIFLPSQYIVLSEVTI